MIYEHWFWPNVGGSGVYIMFERPQILYIGKTTDFHMRLMNHHVIGYELIKRIMKGKTDLVFWPCENPDMSALESYLINIFFPPYNKRIPQLDLIYEGFPQALGDEVYQEIQRILNGQPV